MKGIPIQNLQIKINMQQLTNAEEQVMEHLWKLEKAFMKDLLEAYPNQNLQPQPSLLY
jgi:predicted transcriptional regulator